MSEPNNNNVKILESFAAHCAKWASGPWALGVVLLFLVLWLFSGLFLHFSEGWQMFMETFSAAVTLLMVFLLVRAQTKDTLAMQIKLSEIIGALEGANNRLISIENLSEADIMELSTRYKAIAAKFKSDDVVSIEAIASHEIAAKNEVPEADSPPTRDVP